MKEDPEMETFLCYITASQIIKSEPEPQAVSS